MYQLGQAHELPVVNSMRGHLPIKLLSNEENRLTRRINHIGEIKHLTPH